MTRKKTIVRNIIFSQITLLILLFDAVGVSPVGCCTSTVLNDQFGSKTSRFEYLAYNFSPDRREIVVTSTRCVDYHYALPTRSTHLETTGTGRSSWEVRIPLDPVPDCLMRCRLIVETDPDAPFVRIL